MPKTKYHHLDDLFNMIIAQMASLIEKFHAYFERFCYCCWVFVIFCPRQPNKLNEFNRYLWSNWASLLLNKWVLVQYRWGFGTITLRFQAICISTKMILTLRFQASISAFQVNIFSFQANMQSVWSFKPSFLIFWSKTTVKLISVFSNTSTHFYVQHISNTSVKLIFNTSMEFISNTSAHLFTNSIKTTQISI